MTETCPRCRHVVTLSEASSSRCPNCGYRIPAHPPVTADAAPEKPAEQPAAVAVAAAPPLQPVPLPRAFTAGETIVRPATVAAFVLGLLIFIPIVTQLAAILVGACAVLRTRKENERVTLAWIGMLIAVLTMAAWVLLFTLVNATTAAAGRAVRMAPMGGVGIPVTVETEETTADWKEQMLRVYHAAAAYRRDFRAWPSDLSMLSRSLPTGFVLSSKLTFRPVPSTRDTTLDWVMIVSEPYQRDSEKTTMLDVPHRLILRLGGTIESIPAAEADALLREQPADTPSTSESMTPTPTP